MLVLRKSTQPGSADDEVIPSCRENHSSARPPIGHPHRCFTREDDPALSCQAQSWRTHEQFSSRKSLPSAPRWLHPPSTVTLHIHCVSQKQIGWILAEIGFSRSVNKWEFQGIWALTYETQNLTEATANRTWLPPGADGDKERESERSRLCRMSANCSL